MWQRIEAFIKILWTGVKYPRPQTVNRLYLGIFEGTRLVEDSYSFLANTMSFYYLRDISALISFGGEYFAHTALLTMISYTKQDTAPDPMFNELKDTFSLKY